MYIFALPCLLSHVHELYTTVLVAGYIGGYNDSETPTDEIYCYKPSDDRWHMVGHLTSARYQAVAAMLPGNKVFVVGGIGALVSWKLGVFDSKQVACVCI